MVRAGERLNPSTFGAVGEEPKVGTLYCTVERPEILPAIWVATRIPSVPCYRWAEGFFYVLLHPAIKAVINIMRKKRRRNEVIYARFKICKRKS